MFARENTRGTYKNVRDWFTRRYIVVRRPSGKYGRWFFYCPGREKKIKRLTWKAKQTNIPSSVNTPRGIRPGRIFGGGEKTTPKLADLSPVLVYFSVIPFSPVTENRFIFNVAATLFFSSSARCTARPGRW